MLPLTKAWSFTSPLNAFRALLAFTTPIIQPSVANMIREHLLDKDIDSFAQKLNRHVGLLLANKNNQAIAKGKNDTTLQYKGMNPKLAYQYQTVVRGIHGVTVTFSNPRKAHLS